MKSMRLVLFAGSLIGLMFLSAETLHAQSTDQLISQEKIIPAQAGTVQLVNGTLTITLTEKTLRQLKEKDATYYVSLTPVGDCGPLKLKEKANDKFTVQELSSSVSNGTFDYVVMVKRNVYTGIKQEAVPK